jgi:phosphate transport system ATP-binding protein
MKEGMAGRAKIRVSHLDFWYGETKILSDVCIDFLEQQVTAVIGPSGGGKTTFLSCLNRMNDLIPGTRLSGEILLDGENVYDDGIDVTVLRCRVGMVFQKSNPFPKSVFDNVAYGLRVNGWKDKYLIERRVRESLKRAGLWGEVKDRLRSSALELSGGQQQKLCIARALAVEPEVLLMDDPAGALDPVARTQLEELIVNLRNLYTIILVTHNLQQAARVSDRTAFFYYGKLVEVNDTKEIFTKPESRETEDYVTGRFS